MNPATAQAEVIVDELVRDGLRHAVLSPGSRNAALAFALHAAARRERLALHVRVDERSAGYLALGIAAATGEPVAVVCTSGTAATNLHPAVTEAGYAAVPLLVLTADRPPELRAAGANQTIDQHGLYTTSVRWFGELAVAENRPGQNAYWRSQICRAVHAALGGSRPAAPVHLNLPFREPLVPDEPIATGTDEPEGAASEWCESLAGRDDRRPWTEFAAPEPETALLRPRSPHGLVLLAEHAHEHELDWAVRLGWPVLSETGGVGAGGETLLPTGMWLLNLAEFLRAHRPEQVVCVGRPTVFRQVQRLLADSGVETLLLYGGHDAWPAPAHDVSRVADSVDPSPVTPDPEWLETWRAADQKAGTELAAALARESRPYGPVVAARVLDALPAGATLLVGSSNPTRDVALSARRRADVRVHRNRGVAGIDGTVSTAIGVALARRSPTYALLGDLTFLHDANGLLLGPHERRPDLTMVVCNDDGGGIFSLLEQGHPNHAEPFERVFGTPHGTDLAALCAAHGVSHRLVDETELGEALRYRPGLRVIEVRTPRDGLRELHQRLSEAVSSAVLG
ncbi:2-succinyl-5-enolpyruvyl-6-hydroxy-3-cyclohexene-1-carboxylic-acid synthase [Actinopolyspora xinjiangensis]|uniref:2-succinyl-5-enolpyruvyl-6-hydroxy-3- cyclohexene-1-carboxylic-acid synthase n=1 Tax=Actinopolyspora xinjiangensis TaxID=405564 RepID=UPI000B8612E0|nr:2-succinyl-5-enolpyruvyl-6-hydroxy-3-cyclohexene-1-carboxylic-acid synthase [Actinopolyspora xinjiangensis]